MGQRERQLCREIIQADYPKSAWNIYPFHFSDGDNWSADDTRQCIEMLRNDILPQVNQFAYGQVESPYGSGQFIKDLREAVPGLKRLLPHVRPHLRRQRVLIAGGGTAMGLEVVMRLLEPWPMKFVNGRVEDASTESNMAAYIAVGVLHHWAIRQDRAFLQRMWPVVRRALDLVVDLLRRRRVLVQGWIELRERSGGQRQCEGEDGGD